MLEVPAGCYDGSQWGPGSPDKICKSDRALVILGTDVYGPEVPIWFLALRHFGWIELVSTYALRQRGRGWETHSVLPEHELGLRASVRIEDWSRSRLTYFRQDGRKRQEHVACAPLRIELEGIE